MTNLTTSIIFKTTKIINFGYMFTIKKHIFMYSNQQSIGNHTAYDAKPKSIHVTKICTSIEMNR